MTTEQYRITLTAKQVAIACQLYAASKTSLPGLSFTASGIPAELVVQVAVGKKRVRAKKVAP